MTGIKLNTKYKDYKTSSDGNNHKSKEKFKLAIGLTIVNVIGFIFIWNNILWMCVGLRSMWE